MFSNAVWWRCFEKRVFLFACVFGTSMGVCCNQCSCVSAIHLCRPLLFPLASVPLLFVGTAERVCRNTRGRMHPIRTCVREGRRYGNAREGRFAEKGNSSCAAPRVMVLKRRLLVFFAAGDAGRLTNDGERCCSLAAGPTCGVCAPTPSIGLIPSLNRQGLKLCLM